LSGPDRADRSSLPVPASPRDWLAERQLALADGLRRLAAKARAGATAGDSIEDRTHLSIALGMACCQHDYRVRFVTAAELVTLLVEAQQQGTWPQGSLFQLPFPRGRSPARGRDPAVPGIPVTVRTCAGW